MKKLIIALLSLLLIAFFCACTEEMNEVSKDFSENKTESAVSSENGSASGLESSNAVSDGPSDKSDPESSNPVFNNSSDNQNNDQSGDNSENSNGDVSGNNGGDNSGNNGGNNGGWFDKDDNNGNNGDDDKPIFNDIGDAELLPTGYLIYNGAAYTQTSYDATNCERYANVYDKYAKLFPDTRINVINPPLSAINIINPLVAEMVPDQGKVLDKMESHIYGDVNFVNLKNIFIQHRGEYLYFKSDYHWTQLGAYYAYYEYARSIGITPTPLSDFEERIISTDFIGKANDYACDDRINSFYDTIHCYMPRKEHTMTIYQPWGEYATYDNCINVSKKSYSCFTRGDNPFIVIDVPENDSDKSVLVIKESSANAFVPFLTEHYGKIYVIDPRSITVDVRDLVVEKGIDDIIFFSMASTNNRSTYCSYYESMIGL